MKFKYYLQKYVLGILVFVFVIMGFNYIVDPLQYYRVATLYEPQYSTNARFQMPGIIRNFDYNTIIVGTSMSQNFVESSMDEKLGVKSLNAAISGASSKEQFLVASLALQTGKVSNMYWEINFDSLYGDVNRVRDEHGDFPFYLYDSNILTDFWYLFSYFPIKQAYELFVENAKGSRLNRDVYQLYKFGAERVPISREEIAEKLANADQNKVPFSKEHSYNNMLNHFEQNILPVIKENPDVQFTLYYPPFSIIYWFEVNNRNEQMFSDRMKLKEEIYRQVMHLDNVMVYDFQSDDEITHVIQHYMDTSHYFMEINNLMIDYFSSEQHRITSLDEVRKKIDSLKNQVTKFDIKRMT